MFIIKINESILLKISFVKYNKIRVYRQTAEFISKLYQHFADSDYFEVFYKSNLMLAVAAHFFDVLNSFKVINANAKLYHLKF